MHRPGTLFERDTTTRPRPRGAVIIVAVVGIWAGTAINQAADQAGRDRSAPSGSKPTIDDAIAFGKARLAAVNDLKDYTATLKKTEWIDKRVVEQELDMKFRTKPFGVYLLYQSPKEKGRQALYSAGENDDRLLVREGGEKGRAGTYSMPPDDPKVLYESRYPVTDIGMAKLLEKALAIWEADKKTAPGSVAVVIDNHAQLEGTEYDLVQVTHLKQSAGAKYQLGRVFFDKQSKLPVRAEQYGWPDTAGAKPLLLEEYTYTNIELNVGLADGDFDSKNDKYSFNAK
ncbi:MAG: DUF1571 domain-containing protein [Planctomycetales bacterium]